MNSVELFVREHLAKYGMHEIEALIEDLSEDGKHGGDSYNGEKLKNVYSDLESVFRDERFMKEYENITRKEKTTKEDMDLKGFEDLNVEYLPPLKIDWSGLFGGNQEKSESEIMKAIEEVKKGETGVDLAALNQNVDGTYNNRGSCFVTELEDIPKSIREYMYKHGIRKLKQGKVAVVIMSGGDGSRLGYNGPKGTYPIGKISKDSFFKIFCQKIQSLIRLLAKEQNLDHDHADSKSRETKYLGEFEEIPLYIMTSENNNNTIEKYFKENKNFGLKNVTFFKQDSVPSLNINNNYSFFISRDLRILKSPNGNGGIFNCMKKQGIIDDMYNKGIEYIFIHCIDNPLCKICDPFFIGYTDLLNLQVSTKTINKKDINENIGSVAQKFTRDFNTNKMLPCIIEYTELNKLGHKKENFTFGSIGIHLFHLKFIQEISEKIFEFPYHIANKKIAYLKYLNGHDNSRLKSYIDQPSEINGIKLETFIFDSFAFTSTPVHCINVSRDEFSPVKSISGQESPETCQNAISNLNKKLLNRALNTSCNSIPGGLSSSSYLEISPLVSYYGENLDHFSQLKTSNDHKFIYINDSGDLVLLDGLQ
ncbi:UDP-N-acetylglucosamine pyrophosphorylase [Cryptosporidium sp. chipmunk genotype I]|uniref:UDP-N-acetylglucosamine pyrophosphorylase n=1 Tax=Cryptosporidium sp. chipmunk genotype I TaxID=1280935 RepID=UPI00351A2F6E|nr:UDP-N-acetylglucosamine pyrophosphorylase [Cryptosporidium sp. chipmunk genotype I]